MWPLCACCSNFTRNTYMLVMSDVIRTCTCHVIRMVHVKLCQHVRRFHEIGQTYVDIVCPTVTRAHRPPTQCDPGDDVAIM